MCHGTTLFSSIFVATMLSINCRPSITNWIRNTGTTKIMDMILLKHKRYQTVTWTSKARFHRNKIWNYPKNCKETKSDKPDGVTEKLFLSEKIKSEILKKLNEKKRLCWCVIERNADVSDSCETNWVFI